MTSDRYSDELIDRTLDVWKGRYTQDIAREDAREIIENTAGFFLTLLRWEQAAQAEVDRLDSLGTTPPQSSSEVRS